MSGHACEITYCRKCHLDRIHEWKDRVADLERQLAEACKLVISAQTERDEAKGKLEKYGTHLTDCKWSGAEPSDCTCGLDRILKGE